MSKSHYVQIGHGGNGIFFKSQNVQTSGHFTGSYNYGNIKLDIRNKITCVNKMKPLNKMNVSLIALLFSICL